MNRRDDDLNPLDHPERWERLVGSIVAAGEPHLAERRERAGVTAVVAGWARPALGAAATVLLMLAATVGLVRDGATDTADAPMLATALVPDAYAAWIIADYEPTVSELVAALDEVER